MCCLLQQSTCFNEVDCDREKGDREERQQWDAESQRKDRNWADVFIWQLLSLQVLMHRYKDILMKYAVQMNSLSMGRLW